jgi:hypothetical protein
LDRVIFVKGYLDPFWAQRAISKKYYAHIDMALPLGGFTMDWRRDQDRAKPNSASPYADGVRHNVYK